MVFADGTEVVMKVFTVQKQTARESETEMGHWELGSVR